MEVRKKTEEDPPKAYHYEYVAEEKTEAQRLAEAKASVFEDDGFEEETVWKLPWSCYEWHAQNRKRKRESASEDDDSISPS